jgi:hypothetical protein
MARKIEAAKSATFTTDDKRAQYARLVVFNHGVEAKIIDKSKTVETVGNGDLQKAFKSLNGGTLLEGKDGITEIMRLSGKGSTTGRPLTTAYAQEVRPFIRKGTLAPTFGRRAGERKAKVEKAAPAPKAKAAPAKAKGKKAPKAAPAPAPEPEPSAQTIAGNEAHSPGADDLENAA